MKRKTSLEDTVQLPIMLISAGDETRETEAKPAAAEPGKRSQIVIRVAAVLLLLAVGGLVAYGASGTSDTPAVGPANPPPPGPELPAPAVATETMTVPTTTAAVGSVKAHAKKTTSTTPTSVSTTSSSPAKSTKSSGQPQPPDFSAIMSSLQSRYHPHTHP
jgi:hypothetical protein